MQRISPQFLVVVGYCLVLLMVETECLPNGAPDGACTTLMPRHQDGGGGFIAAQTGNTPFNVMMSSQTYQKEEYVRVWINDNRSSGSATGYRGLLLQARTVGGNAPLGVWRNAPNNTKLMMCSNANDAVTHSNTNLKSNNSVYEWMPSGNHGMIEFTVTVAESREVFWTSLRSQALQYSRATAVPADRFIVILTAAAVTFLYSFNTN